MKRFRNRIDEERDAALERTEKRLVPLLDLAEDPLMRMAGVDDYEPASVDEVVYG